MGRGDFGLLTGFNGSAYCANYCTIAVQHTLCGGEVTGPRKRGPKRPTENEPPQGATKRPATSTRQASCPKPKSMEVDAPRVLQPQLSPACSPSAASSSSSATTAAIWVQCDACEKWRLLPPGCPPPPESETWRCDMNIDTSHNKCDVPEESTSCAPSKQAGGIVFDTNGYQEGRPHVHARTACRSSSDAPWQFSDWTPARILVWVDTSDGAQRVTIATPTTLADGNAFTPMKDALVRFHVPIAPTRVTAISFGRCPPLRNLFVCKILRPDEEASEAGLTPLACPSPADLRLILRQQPNPKFTRIELRAILWGLSGQADSDAPKSASATKKTLMQLLCEKLAALGLPVADA